MHLKSLNCYKHFFIYNKNVFISRRVHQVSLFPVYNGTAVQISSKIVIVTRFSQRCITFSRKSREDSIVASAYEKFCESTRQREPSLRFPETKISKRKRGQINSRYY